MGSETGNSFCEHEWIEYDDPAAYNDGFNCPSIAICSKCGTEKDIRGSNTLNSGPVWYENFMRFYVSVLVVIYRIIMAPIILVIRFIKEKVISKKEE
jgi:hypothetical protein